MTDHRLESAPAGAIAALVSRRNGPALRLEKFGYSLADQVLSTGGMFVVNVALARVRSKEEYGVFALSYSIFTFLAGLHNAATLEAYTIYGSGRYRERFSKYAPLVARANAGVASGLTALLVLIWLGLHRLRPVLASPALLGMGLGCGGMLWAAFRRRTFYIRRQAERAFAFSAAFFLSCLVMLALAIRAGLLNGWSAFVITALAWLIAGGLIGSERTEHAGIAGDFLREEPGYWREHWRYSRWVLVTALVFQFTTQAYFWVVAGFVSLKEVAELRAIYNLALPVDQGFTAITLLVLPQMAGHFAAREPGKLRQLWLECTGAFLLLSSGFALMVGAGSLPLLHFVYNGKFDGVAPLLRWYVLLPVVMGVGNASNAALKAMERPQTVFYAYLASGATTLLAGIPLVARMGLRGAVYGMLVSATSYASVLALGCYRISRRQAAPGETVPAAEMV